MNGLSEAQAEAKISAAVELFMTHAVETEMTPELFTYVLSHCMCETVLGSYQEPEKALEELLFNTRTLFKLMTGDIDEEELKKQLAALE